MKQLGGPAALLLAVVALAAGRSETPAAPRPALVVARAPRLPEAPAEAASAADPLREQVAISLLWTKLERRPSDPLSLSAESLGLGPDFIETARIQLDALRRAALAEDREAYEIVRHRARRAIAACLDDSPLHRAFRDRLHEWIAALLSE